MHRTSGYPAHARARHNGRGGWGGVVAPDRLPSPRYPGLTAVCLLFFDGTPVATQQQPSNARQYQYNAAFAPRHGEQQLPLSGRRQQREQCTAIRGRRREPDVHAWWVASRGLPWPHCPRCQSITVPSSAATSSLFGCCAFNLLCPRRSLRAPCCRSRFARCGRAFL